jgi:phosphatidylserine/phosphatidylglycerophosphate/cardiolipin synthase-like enzyme
MPGDLSVRAYRSDAKTLLAFDLPKRRTRNLAGFTIEVQPKGKPAYYLYNQLRFEHPERHVQDAAEPPNSSLNAPFHKFRWLHVPGSLHQGLRPFHGSYTYVVTPRYFDTKGALERLDPDLSASVDVEVGSLEKGPLRIAFTRGYTQSQAFVNHFGRDAQIKPRGEGLVYDTSKVAGANARGEQYTYSEAYEWLGLSARETIFGLLDEVAAKKTLRLDMFAYDLNEPDLAAALIELAKDGRARVILDNAALHHSTTKAKPEDDFERLFGQAATGDAAIKRGRFGRYAHDKVLVVSDRSGPKKVMTGSTNFSVTGLYVNSNHVLLFDDRGVAGKYADVFQAVWDGDVKRAAWLETPHAGERFAPAGFSPPVEITFAPHTEELAREVLGEIVTRIEKEQRKAKTKANVLFAVMEMDRGESPVWDILNVLHADDGIFTFGVSDSPRGISLYEPKRKTGVLVTGRPVATRLPPPFNQVPGVGVGHQIHHKFVVCGFGGDDPVVYCGSSNLAVGGEIDNGDNLLAIRDPDVVTAFAIEALALVDHFQFLDRMSPGGGKLAKPAAAAQPRAADSAGWFLSTSDRWTAPYFDPDDLRYVDRRLFA